MSTVDELVEFLVRNTGYIIDELNEKYSMTVEEIKEYKTAKRVIELCKAERENRCVVLPCKVGDTVYVATSRKIGWWQEGYDIVKQVEERKFELYMLDQIGKTIFLTREEAENELKGISKVNE